MRLNHDCIRDILLYIEANTDDNIECISSDTLVEALSKYDKNTLFYHIRRMNTANLFDYVSYSEGKPDFISNLSWTGHNYIDNIRDDEIWSKTKAAASKLASVSFPILIEKAVEIASKSF